MAIDLERRDDPIGGEYRQHAEEGQHHRHRHLVAQIGEHERQADRRHQHDPGEHREPESKHQASSLQVALEACLERRPLLPAEQPGAGPGAHLRLEMDALFVGLAVAPHFSLPKRCARMMSPTTTAPAETTT